RLVEFARHTNFGREHGFDRIRSVSDYQQRVPLRDYEAFWTQFWQQPFPYLKGVTWPEQVPYFALSSGTTSGVTKYLPLTRQLLRGNTRAAITSVAWFLAAHPDVRLLTGKLFFLGGSTDLIDLGALAGAEWGGKVLGGDLSGVTSLEA